jgi:hypothetical protein
MAPVEFFAMVAAETFPIKKNKLLSAPDFRRFGV